MLQLIRWRGATRGRDGGVQPSSGRSPPLSTKTGAINNNNTIYNNASSACTSSFRPGCAATCDIAWVTSRAGTSRPTLPSWTASSWVPVISQPTRQRRCWTSTVTSSSGWCGSRLPCSVPLVLSWNTTKNKWNSNTSITTSDEAYYKIWLLTIGRVLLDVRSWSALVNVQHGGESYYHYNHDYNYNSYNNCNYKL